MYLIFHLKNLINVTYHQLLFFVITWQYSTKQFVGNLVRFEELALIRVSINLFQVSWDV